MNFISLNLIRLLITEFYSCSYVQQTVHEKKELLHRQKTLKWFFLQTNWRKPVLDQNKLILFPIHFI